MPANAILPPPLHSNWPQRELQVLIMISRGMRTNAISEQLSLSPKTISTYRKRLHEKLDVSNDVEMMHLAIKHGLLDAE